MATLDKRKIFIGLGVLVVVAIIALILRLFTGGGASAPESGTSTSGFGTGAVSTTNTGTGTEERVPASGGTASTATPIFKIADGPIAGSTFITTYHPTTTVARFVSATDGHVFDAVIDSPGAAKVAASNTTIPGISRVLWMEEGGGGVLQYVNGSTLKSVALLIATSSTSARIRFFPDDLLDVSVSPDGKTVAYLKLADRGLVGYTARTDGTGEKQLFTLPLTQATLSWPSLNILLVTSKSASGVPGALFRVDAKSGATSLIAYGPGLTGTADPSFAYLFYQMDSGATAQNFHRTVKSGDTRPVRFDTLGVSTAAPERCVWAGTVAYCAVTQGQTGSGFLDLWRQGAMSVPDAIVSFDASSGTTTVLAVPGSRDGGVVSDIRSLSVSADGKYLSFITKNSQTLWGVRLR